MTILDAAAGRSIEPQKISFPSWPLHLALAVLFLGPLISPLFRATGLPLVADAGWLARDLLSSYVCPTPAKSWLILGFPMAVCTRCWGATLGLLAARGLFRGTQNTEHRNTGAQNRRTQNTEHRNTGTQNTEQGDVSKLFVRSFSVRSFSVLLFSVRSFSVLLTLPWPLRFAICALPFLLWPLEIMGEAWGWWYAPLTLLLLNGAQAGFAAGLFFCSIWPGLKAES